MNLPGRVEAMRAIDLFSGGGGASIGLHQAGFEVWGVDIFPQPRYPFPSRFIQADVLSLTAEFIASFDFVWSSPPCQFHSAMKTLHNAKAHVNLIPQTRALLIAAGKPYCIENVPGAPLINPVTLCGSMFSLQAPDGAGLRRHRLFETNFPLTAPSPCRHGSGGTIGIYGAHVRDRRRPSGTNHKSGSNRPWAHAFIAFGVPAGSMTLAELSEAIPPAYSHFIACAWLADAENPKERANAG